jgi:hypothetical protein
MSIVRSLEISLSSLVEESNLIVSGQYLKSFKEEIPITNSASTPLPPFIKKGFSFKIAEILKNTTGIQIPGIIQVPDENWRRELAKHRKKYLDDADRSFTILQYNGELTDIKKASVLFLQHFQGMFELSANNAFEDEAGLEKTQMLLRSAKKKRN